MTTDQERAAALEDFKLWMDLLRQKHVNALTEQSIATIRALLTEPMQEVVTVEEMSGLIQDWRFNDQHQAAKFGNYLAKRFPHGIIVKEKKA
jgi:hypothetical protein